MRILFLVSSLEGGGAERVATFLCNAWAGQGRAVTLCATFSGRGGCSYPVDPDVRTIYLADTVTASAGKAARFRALRALVRQEQPDVIVSFLSHVNIAALLCSVGLGVPVIACERTYPPSLEPPLPSFYRLARWITYRWAFRLLAQTADTKTWFQERFPRTAVDIIPNPIQMPLRRGEPVLHPNSLIASERRVLLAVGRLASRKSMDRAIEAFARVAGDHRDLDLILLGEGPERAALESAAARVGLADRIHLPGFAGNLEDWYRRADIFLMPSSYEGFPNVLIEAMAHGLPTISFDIKSGPRDITDNGRRGLLLPDRDHVAGMAAALADLLSDDARRHDLGARAREVIEIYSEDHILREWDSLLDDAATGQTKGQPG